MSFILKQKNEMREQFSSYPPEIFENTLKIAEEVDLDFDFDQMHLPPYTIPAEYNSAGEYVRALCYEGLHKKYPQVTEEIKERLEYELGIINEMGFAGYFLITWDFIRFAHENKLGKASSQGQPCANNGHPGKTPAFRLNAGCCLSSHMSGLYYRYSGGFQVQPTQHAFKLNPSAEE